ncbi:LPS export ABC transporter ATP-binding protein [Marinicaulis aureus]|uniref:LPS export ABC transporter ATP-binding protein n=1 Tax=Hyphococcus aureus TaxID=2666033 RepID=A0ABW1L000_9PROT
MSDQMEPTNDTSPAQSAKPQKLKPKVIEGGGALAAENLGKSFKRRPVVRGVSMSVKRGEVVGLLGPNGAGKTTCFYMITGLIPADRGRIMIDGNDVTNLPMYQRARLGVGYLPQEASIFRGMTVEQNLRAVVELVERNKDKQQTIIDDLLNEFHITHIRNAPAIALSGGERRRVEIARALATAPSFMLLDEPFAGIDPLAIAEIRELVAHLKDRGLGVLITDHNVRETLDIIDRAYIIHEGEVLLEGAPGEIVGDKDVRRVYLGDRFQM